jgi:DNA-binding NarL/FixJ family response regulator
MNILLADDHPLFREGVKAVLLKLAPLVNLIEANDYPSAFIAIQRHHIDLALLDLYMPGMASIDGITRLRAAFPEIPVVVLSATEKIEEVKQLLAVGVLGFITKSSPSSVILEALQQILGGGIYVPPNMIPNSEMQPIHIHQRALSKRQFQVLRELAKGYSNRQIGERLDVSEGTVKIHIAAIFRLLKVNNRTELVLVSQKMGLHRT